MANVDAKYRLLKNNSFHSDVISFSFFPLSATAYLVVFDFSSSVDGGGIFSGSGWNCDWAWECIEGWYESPRL